MTHQSPLEGFSEYRMSERTRLIESLADFRREWQKTAEGESLIGLEASVGLILADIADRLELTGQERHAMLGSKLITEVDCLMEERIVANLNCKSAKWDHSQRDPAFKKNRFIWLTERDLK